MPAAEAFEAVHRDPPVGRLAHRRLLVGPAGSRSTACSPAAMPSTRRARHVRGHRGDERVAPRAVAAAHPPQVAVELPALDEIGERELIGQRSAALALPAHLRRRVREALGQHEPAEPQRRRQRLEAEPGVDDVVGRHAL